MKKDDWYSLGGSILLHVLVLLLLMGTNLGVAEPEPIGFVEVDFGPLAEGRPVQRAAEDRPEIPEPEDPTPEPQPEPKAAPPQVAKPVELAEQETEVQDEERVQAPETDTVSPVEQPEPAPVVKPEPRPEPTPVQPEGGGARNGTEGEPEGDEGPGRQTQRSSPFNIEGLNRRPVRTSLPDYTEKVNAEIVMSITVDPQGRIVRMVPVKKANARLESAIRQALARWRFNRLPPNAPQENQTGTVTFRFRLE